MQQHNPLGKRLEIIQSLLSRDAKILERNAVNINIQNAVLRRKAHAKVGQNALHFAAAQGDEAMVTWLLEHGADIESTTEA